MGDSTSVALHVRSENHDCLPATPAKSHLIHPGRDTYKTHTPFATTYSLPHTISVLGLPNSIVSSGPSIASPRLPQVISVLGLPSSIVSLGGRDTTSRLPQVISVLGLPRSIVSFGASRLPQVISVLCLPSSIVSTGLPMEKVWA